MKGKNNIIFSILMVLLIILITNIIGIIKLSITSNVLLWLISVIIITVLVGYQKNRGLYLIDIIQTVIIYSFTYLIFIYILGVFFGYFNNPYNLELIKIVKNTLPVLVVIICQEIIRYIIISKSDNKKVFYIITILIIGFNVMYGIGNYSLDTAMGIFEAIGLFILPTIVTNFLLSFITSKVGYVPSIIYRVITELYVYIVPIFPDLGTYIESVLKIVFPTLLFLKINTLFEKKKFNVARENKLKLIIKVPAVTVICIAVMLTSGLFKYYSLAIGSNSMYPYLKVGYVVIIEKYNKDKLNKIEIGDILVFHHENKTIVHRVIKINEKNEKYTFNTKGDNNNNEDNYDIDESDVIGVVNGKIPYIGLPSVWLSEKFS